MDSGTKRTIHILSFCFKFKIKIRLKNVHYTEEFGDRQLQVLSACSGYGGIEKGLHIAGVKHRVVTYVEIESFAVANLVAAMETGAIYPAPIWTNLKTFNAKHLRGKIDIFTAGYPCQPFSAAGKRKGKDDPRHLWPYIQTHIRTIRPIYCFF